MKNRPLLFCFVICILFSFNSSAQKSDCDTDAQLDIAVPEGPKPWSNLELNNNPCQFQFAIVTDRTGGHRPGVFMEGIRRLNLLQPEFVMSVGDLIEGYTEDRTVLDREWNEFKGFIDHLEMPFFYLPGNHDITNAVMEEVWKEKFGPTYYHFKYKDVLFLCLNTEDQYRGSNKGTISDEQYAYIENTLAENTEVKWTMVFMHQPLWILEDTKRWQDVEALLAKRKHTVFVGHHHRYTKYERNNGKYFMLATTGGGSGLRGPQLGEFDHVVWITMTEEGPIIANLQLEGIWNEDVVTEQTKDFLAEMWKHTPIQPQPLFVADNAFTAGKVKVKITNDRNVPMQVKLKNGFSWDMQSSLDKNKLEVPPNSVEFVEIDIKTKKEKPIEELEPVKLSVTASYLGGELPEVSVPYLYNIGPEPTYTINKAPKPVKVDGQLSEWATLRNVVNTGNTEDLDVKFDLSYDDNNVYVAINVKDDSFVKDTSIAAWKQDFLGFVLNADPQSSSALNTGEAGYRSSLLAALTPATTDLPSTLIYDEKRAAEVKVICKSHRAGYLLEASIPISYIQERQGKDWQSLRFNLIAQDFDKGKEEHPRHFWKPAWTGKEHRIGSGLFFKK